MNGANRRIILPMPRVARIIAPHYPHHITQRGNNRADVFFDDEDRATYLSLLKDYRERSSVDVWAYCLMPNHVHIIGEIENSQNLCKFMHGLNRSYTLYYNDVYKKVGHLWQGRFKSKIIVKDEYLISCINYIELNPIRAGLASSPEKYNWSSYKERVLSTGKICGLINSISI